MTAAGRQALLRWLIAALGSLWALSMTACADGYPTEDSPLPDPAVMSQAQLLAALNAMGDESASGKRWHYSLDAGCTLEISVRKGGTTRHRVLLEGAEVTTRSFDGLTEIRLVPRAGGEARALTVLETRRWPDTVRARSLLTHLEARCGQPLSPPT